MMEDVKIIGDGEVRIKRRKRYEGMIIIRGGRDKGGKRKSRRKIVRFVENESFGNVPKTRT